MADSGKIIVLTAPSGSGKTTLAKRLLQDFTMLRFSVSATTRAPRAGETEGIHYYFKSPKAFSELIRNEAFIEYQEFYNGTLYGTLKEDVDNQLKSGYFVLLDIEVKGAMNIKQMYGNNCLCIFVKPPSIQILKQRLTERGTEDDDSLKLRLERVSMELEYADRFDHVVVNDDLDRAYGEIQHIVEHYIKA